MAENKTENTYSRLISDENDEYEVYDFEDFEIVKSKKAIAASAIKNFQIETKPINPADEGI